MSTDDGLTEAVQRVRQVPEIGEWLTVTPEWVIEAIARAAREDVADRTRQAQADALEALADDLGESRIPVRDGGTSYIDLAARAAEIRAGAVL